MKRNSLRKLTLTITMAIITVVIMSAGVFAAQANQENRVWFETKDGKRIEMDAKKTFHLDIDTEGSFKSTYKNPCWKALESINKGRETDWHCWINSDGRFQPPVMSADQNTKVMDESYVLDGLGNYDSMINFKIEVNNKAYNKVHSIRTFVDGREVNMDKPYRAPGFIEKQVNFKCYDKDGKELKEINDRKTAVVFERAVEDGGFAHIWDTGFLTTDQTPGHTRIFRAYLRTNPNIKAEFKVITGNVPIKDFNLRVPKTWEIDKWSSVFKSYAGVMDGELDDNSFLDKKPSNKEFAKKYNSTHYQVDYSPIQTTERELKWEALTPEIATFEPLHSRGIVPIKAGVAKFKVTSPKLKVSRLVEIEFKYKNPLKAIKVDDVINLKREMKLPVKFESTTGNDVTEQRVSWTFAKGESVFAPVKQVVFDDKQNNMAPQFVENTIYAKKTGWDILTGVPMDKTAGAKNIQLVVMNNMSDYSAVIFKDGKSLTENNVKVIKDGTEIKSINLKAKEGKKFDGWYTDANCKHRWNFKDKVRKNLTLYPKWKNNTKTYKKLRLSKPKIKSIRRANKNSIKVSLFKENANKYEVVYSTNRLFKNAKVAKSSKPNIVIKKVSRKKAYFIKIRKYIKVGKKIYYSEYTKTVTTR